MRNVAVVAASFFLVKAVEILLVDAGFENYYFALLCSTVAVVALYCLVSFRVGSSPFFQTLTAGSRVSVGTGALTTGVSDGVNGDLNIHSHTDNNLYIKNMVGGSLEFTITFLGCQNKFMSTIL